MKANNFFSIFFLSIGLIMLTAAFSLHGQSNYYTSDDGNWSSQSRWAGNSSPGSWIGGNDTVFVDHHISLNSNVGLAGVIVISQNGSLTGNSSFTIHNSGKVISHGGELYVQNLTVAGELTTNGDVEVSHDLNSYSSPTLSIDGDFTIGRDATFGGADVTVGGEMRVGNNLNTNTSPSLSIAGDFIIGGDATLNGAVVTVGGKMRVEDNITLNGASTLEVVDGLHVEKSTTLNSGTLEVSGQSDFNGNLTINSNGALLNQGDLTTNGEVYLSNASATIENNGSITTNGSFKNQGQVTNNGDWESNDEFFNSWGGDFTNDGNLVANDGITNESHLINNGSLTSNGDFYNGYSGNYTNNGSTEVDGDIENNNTINGSGSTLVTGQVDGSGTVSGDGYICNPDGTTDPTQGTHNNIDPTVNVCGIADENPFPVDLIAFDATKRDNVIELHWSTASEINNDYFTIERSMDGNQFAELATVEGSGNSNQVVHYSFTDGSYTPGKTIYYRVKQTDYDGTYSYSGVVDVSTSPSLNANVFPNPASPGQTVTIHTSSDNARISIYDMQGRLIQDFSAQHEHIQLNTGDLQPGTYVVRIAAPGKEQVVSKRLFIK